MLWKSVRAVSLMGRAVPPVHSLGRAGKVIEQAEGDGNFRP